MISGVLFDLDDTLVDHQSAAARAVVHWAHDHGLRATADELAERWARISNRHYAAWQRREVTQVEQQNARVREFLPHLDLRRDERAQAAWREYQRLYRAAWQAFDDARPALERAGAAGLKVGVLTNGEEEWQRGKLERAGVAELVPVVVASGSLPWSKPDARAFHAACERLGTEPGQTLMVGDNAAVDVRGARRAGLPGDPGRPVRRARRHRPARRCPGDVAGRALLRGRHARVNRWVRRRMTSRADVMRGGTDGSVDV